MTIERKLLGTTPVSGEVLPEAVSFDGSNDYLSRSSDLTGNADGKTFTFSCWAYCTGESFLYEIPSTASYNGKFSVSNTQVKAQNSSAAAILRSNSYVLPLNTWSHILISVDLSDTSKRHVYINDVNSGVTWHTFTNDSIDFTDAVHWISARKMADSTPSVRGPDRKANLFLDYTYRDLSVTANRRLFIDADGKPADTDTLAALNPIVYMPLTDPATAGSNSGTGGDFTVNGVLATAERGPNQDNCVAMKFDGSNDYIRRNSSLNGTGQTARTMTFSAVLTTEKLTSYPRSGTMIDFRDNTLSLDQAPLRLLQSINGNYGLTIRDTTDTNVVNQYVLGNHLGHGQTNHVCFSIDLDNASACKLYINGIVQANWLLNTPSGGFRFNANRLYIGSDTSAGVKTNGSMGEFYWDDGFIDLATENPFWDSDTNRPIPLNKVIENTGTTPLIAMRMNSNSAETNLGTGGQFGLVGTPYVGQRGGNEFWARSARNSLVSSSAIRTNYLSNASLGNVLTTTGAYSFVAFSKIQSTSQAANTVLFSVGNDSAGLHLFLNTAEDLILRQAGVNTILKVDAGRYRKKQRIFITYDGTNLYSYVDDVDSGGTVLNNIVSGAKSIPTYTTATANILSSNINFTGGNSYDFPGSVAVAYFTPNYINFSQESIRTKFMDQLGYPKDLTQQIEDGDIPNPLIYMKFDNPAALGTNSGTGGNFTVNGALTTGTDVLP